jgi:hypothetical protein
MKSITSCRAGNCTNFAGFLCRNCGRMMCRQHYNVSKGLCLACAARSEKDGGCAAAFVGLVVVVVVIMVGYAIFSGLIGNFFTYHVWTTDTNAAIATAVASTPVTTVNGSSHVSISFIVQSTIDWQDTRLFIAKGTTITIKYVSGSWRPWPGVDFDGNGCTQGCDPTTHNIIEGCDHGGLIGRIGDSQMICILNNKRVTATESGNLYLRINDDKQDDDSGDITVQISSK